MDAPDLSAAEAFDKAELAAEVPAVEDAPTAEVNGEDSPTESIETPEVPVEDEAPANPIDGLDLSLEDIKAAIADNASLKEQLGDRKLEDVLGKADELAAHEKQWQLDDAQKAIDDEAKQREDEEPADTIARLDQQLADSNQKFSTAETARQGKEQATQSLAAYDTLVSSEVDGSDLSDVHKEFLKSVLQSSNPSNTVDISNKIDVARSTKAMVANLQKFSDNVISNYTDGKAAVPPVAPSTPASSDAGGKPIKTIKGATAAAIEKVSKALRRS